MDPRAVVPESNMPAYPWLPLRPRLDPRRDRGRRMRTLRKLGDPYTDEDIAKAAAAAVEGKTELDALVVYLQGLGIASEPRQAQAASAVARVPVTDGAP
jgi:cytochrome c oxidase cbb3-type subunit 2